MANVNSSDVEGSNEMVARVASAIDAASITEGFHTYRYRDCPAWDEAFDLLRTVAARAAIEAMREPNDAMWDRAETEQMVLGDALGNAARTDPLAEDAFSFPTLRIWLGVLFWRAMIDEALGCNRRALPFVMIKSSDHRDDLL